MAVRIRLAWTNFSLLRLKYSKSLNERPWLSCDELFGSVSDVARTRLAPTRGLSLFSKSASALRFNLWLVPIAVSEPTHSRACQQSRVKCSFVLWMLCLASSILANPEMHLICFAESVAKGCLCHNACISDKNDKNTLACLANFCFLLHQAIKSCFVQPLSTYTSNEIYTISLPMVNHAE